MHRLTPRQRRARKRRRLKKLERTKKMINAVTRRLTGRTGYVGEINTKT